MAGLSRRAFAQILGVSEGQLQKLIRAGEFGSLPPRTKLTEEMLVAWKSSRREVLLSREKYLTALRFSVEEFYLGGTKSDFGSNTRRGAGKFIDDYTRGKLGELAFGEFLIEALDLEVELDFEHHQDIPAQDIESVRRRGRRTRNPPGIRVSIKTTKLANTYLLVPEDEFASPDRRSEAYVLMRVDLPEDHLVRELFLAGGLPGLHGHVHEALSEIVASDGNVGVQVAGFAWRGDFPAEPVTSVDDLTLSKPNRMLRSGQLRTSEADWLQFAERLLPSDRD